MAKTKPSSAASGVRTKAPDASGVRTKAPDASGVRPAAPGASGARAEGGPAFRPARETVDMGGRAYTVTALPCGVALRRLLPLMERARGGVTLADGDALSEMLALCHLSVAAADPAITLAALEDGLAMPDLPALFMAVAALTLAPRQDGGA